MKHLQHMRGTGHVMAAFIREMRQASVRDFKLSGARYIAASEQGTVMPEADAMGARVKIPFRRHNIDCPPEARMDSDLV